MQEIMGVAKNGKWVLAPNEEELYTQWLIDCDGKFVRGRFSRVGTPKTDKQLKTHFGLAVMKVRNAMIKKGEAICGVSPNKKMVHEILSDACGGVGPLGETKRLSQMTSDEAVKFFENIRDFAQKYLHMGKKDIVIPDPDPNWRQKEQT